MGYLLIKRLVVQPPALLVHMLKYLCKILNPELPQCTRMSVNEARSQKNDFAKILEERATGLWSNIYIHSSWA